MTPSSFTVDCSVCAGDGIWQNPQVADLVQALEPCPRCTDQALPILQEEDITPEATPELWAFLQLANEPCVICNGTGTLEEPGIPPQSCPLCQGEG